MGFAARCIRNSSCRFNTGSMCLQVNYCVRWTSRAVSSIQPASYRQRGEHGDAQIHRGLNAFEHGPCAFSLSTVVCIHDRCRYVSPNILVQTELQTQNIISLVASPILERISIERKGDSDSRRVLLLLLVQSIRTRIVRIGTAWQTRRTR